MAEGNVKVTIRAVDKVSPVLKRIGRRLWWMQYGGFVTTGLVVAVVVLTAIAAFLRGRYVA
jgi:hypothetical protein